LRCGAVMLKSLKELPVLGFVLISQIQRTVGSSFWRIKNPRHRFQLFRKKTLQNLWFLWKNPWLYYRVFDLSRFLLETLVRICQKPVIWFFWDLWLWTPKNRPNNTRRFPISLALLSAILLHFEFCKKVNWKCGKQDLKKRKSKCTQESRSVTHEYSVSKWMKNDWCLSFMF